MSRPPSWRRVYTAASLWGAIKMLHSYGFQPFGHHVLRQVVLVCVQAISIAAREDIWHEKELAGEKRERKESKCIGSQTGGGASEYGRRTKTGPSRESRNKEHGQRHRGHRRPQRRDYHREQEIVVPQETSALSFHPPFSVGLKARAAERRSVPPAPAPLSGT
ncbi:unnamed protein product [Pleuronectes platessa]|uniref:Uncharacterized protein n=1 Tax=Pleuronectes platessa TaxID=8262 RepID=A0A9N7VFE6_PLEPL|nr:unnamed protein product [Pleuronectes platessa]